ncbi:MAG: tRNA preQ1(34) S-adenosylmethionine ribosyltransferase-isomerase QueA [Epsilonproteobacteria bacterium]|nr:tRNA preQ1(34) S-adenosylmethionine ribosyltransferase-isomerase QueA [Campylobacterota bacterium]
MDKDLLTSSYDYNLPKEQIALYGANPPEDARLLIYKRDTKEIIDTTFWHFIDYIPKDSAIFINDTKVIKARIFGYKNTGGKIELLFERELKDNNFLVYIRGKVKVGTILYFEDNLEAKVIKLNEDGSRVVKFFKDNKELNFIEIVSILEKIGHTPLPPYIKREAKREDEKMYQPIFAKNIGAVAAPTASLHFSKESFNKLKEKFEVYNLTLHIGAGTFKGVESQNILDHKMHSEYFNIPKEAANVIDSPKKILAIGTTVTRTIEYYARTKKLSGECNLFLHPKNPPIRVNYLLTNFHLPKSTLIMLVSAFIGRETTLKLYNIAIKKGYRFYSYGDGMLIL